MVYTVDEDEKQCVNNPYALKGQQDFASFDNIIKRNLLLNE